MQSARLGFCFFSSAILVATSTWAKPLVLAPVVFRYDLASDKEVWGTEFPSRLVETLRIPAPNRRYSAPFRDVFFQNDRVVVCYRECSEPQEIQALGNHVFPPDDTNPEYSVRFRVNEEAGTLPSLLERSSPEEFIERARRTGENLETAWALQTFAQDHRFGKDEAGMAFSRLNSATNVLSNQGILSLATIYYWTNLAIDSIMDRGFKLPKRIVVEVGPINDPNRLLGYFRPRNSTYPRFDLVRVDGPDRHSGLASRAFLVPLDPSIIIHEIGHVWFESVFFPWNLNYDTSVLSEMFAYYLAMDLLNTDVLHLVYGSGEGRQESQANLDMLDQDGVMVLGNTYLQKYGHPTANLLIDRLWLIRQMIGNDAKSREILCRALEQISANPFSTVRDFQLSYRSVAGDELGNLEEIGDIGALVLDLSEDQRVTPLPKGVHFPEPEEIRRFVPPRSRRNDSPWFSIRYALREFSSLTNTTVTVWDRQPSGSRGSGGWYLTEVRSSGEASPNGEKFAPEVFPPTWLYLVTEVDAYHGIILGAFHPNGRRVEWSDRREVGSLAKDYLRFPIFTALRNDRPLFFQPNVFADPWKEMESWSEPAATDAEIRGAVRAESFQHAGEIEFDGETHPLGMHSFRIAWHPKSEDADPSSEQDSRELRIFSVPTSSLRSSPFPEVFPGETMLAYESCRNDAICLRRQVLASSSGL